MAQSVVGPAEQGILDWLYLPGFGLAAIGMSVLILVILGLCLLASLWTVRVPGPLTRGERGSNRTTRTVIGVMALGGPILIGTAIVYLHFPICPPQVVVLSSRSRSRGEAADSDWTERWSQLLKSTRAASVLDAGLIVDTASRALLDHPPPGGEWRRGDPEVIEQISQAAYRAIAPEVHGAASIPARQAFAGSPGVLPPWIVESLELAAIKALCQARNVSHVYILCEPRITAAGPTWSGAFVTYLEAGASRPKPTSIQLEQVSAHMPVVLQAFPVVIHPDGKSLAMLYFRVNPNLTKTLLDANWEEARTVVVHTSIQDVTGRSLTVTTLNRTSEFQACALELPAVEIDPTAWIAHPFSGQRLPWPASRSASPSGRSTVAQSSITLVCKAEMQDRWRSTLAELLRQDSGFADWRQALRESLLLQIPATPDDVRVATTIPVSGVVIDTTREGVWVYDARLADAVRSVPRPKLLEESRTKVSHRVEAGNEGVPGPYGWDGLQLPISDRYRLLLPDDDHDIARALARSMLISSGSQGRYPEPPDRLVGAVELSSTIDGQLRTGLVTFLGLMPERHGLLSKTGGAPPDSFDRPRFLAFWTSVFRGVNDAALSTTALSTGADDSASTDPAVLLNAGQLSDLRGGAVRWPLTWCAIGLAMFGSWVLISRRLDARSSEP